MIDAIATENSKLSQNRQNSPKPLLIYDFQAILRGNDFQAAGGNDRIKPMNDGFAGRLPTIQKPLFFLGFSRVPKKISMEISIFHLV